MMNQRQAEHAIDPIFLERWSPRAFDMSDMPEADLLAMFEAARWAPSAFNSQPWRFLYARRSEPDWALFLDLLIPWNQGWAHSASALVYVLSDEFPTVDRHGNPKPSSTHRFDSGAAWASLALQASLMGYFAHGMSGIQYDRARDALRLPPTIHLNAAVAIGRIGDPAILDEKQRAREYPSDRKPIADFVFQGPYPPVTPAL
jgi:nitroreductase